MHTEFAEWPDPDRADFSCDRVAGVFDYWSGIDKSSSGLPLREACEPLVDIPRLVTIIMLIQIPDPDDLDTMFYRVIGSELADWTGGQTGETVKHVYLGTDWQTVETQHRYVIEQRKPQLVRRQLGHIRERDFRAYERVLMPLSRDGGSVDMILGACTQLSFSGPNLLRCGAMRRTPGESR